MFRWSAFFFSTAVFAATALAAGPSAADLAREIHQAGLDPNQCYRVRDLTVRRQDVKLYLTEGYLIFSKAVAGRHLSAVFTTDVEGGDGEVILLPPYRGERQSLASFINSPNLDEHLNGALMLFTDGTGRELIEQMEKDGSGRKVPEIGATLAEKWERTLENIRESFELRLVEDLLSGSAARSGFVFLSLAGREHGNFDIVYDPRAREQILAGQLTERGGRLAYNIWTSFLAKNIRTGASKQMEPGFTLPHFSIDAKLDDNLRMNVTTKATARIGEAPLRVLRFEISPAMKVTSVRVDGAPVEIFYRDSMRGRALGGSDDSAFLVVTPELLDTRSEHEIVFEHEGEVILPAGNGVYYVGARATWYPRSLPGFSTYDLSFRYPKKLTLVTAGDPVADRFEGDSKITQRRIATPVRFAGFNLGEYDRVTGTAQRFTVEVYGNRRLEAALVPKPAITPADVAAARLPRRADSVPTTTLPPPDPHARLRTVAADVSASLEYFSGLFGSPALKTLTIAPIPGAFGQGFPGLVYLSTIAYLDPADRPASVREGPQQLFFSDLIEAHEVAHQWWGNVVISGSYQDDWMMEALANYSSLMWLEKKKGAKAVESILDDYRNRLIAKGKDGHTLESAGPITWGIRLESTGNHDAWRAITYEKGAWILHMLRRRLGDEKFLKFLAELRRRYEFRAVTTEDFRALAREFLPPKTSVDSIDAFFDNWVYATGVPVLKVQSSVKGSASSFRVSGTVTQSGVDDDFSIDAPVEIQFAKGPPQTIWVHTSNEPVPFSVVVKQAPVKVALGSAVLTAKK